MSSLAALRVLIIGTVWPEPESSAAGVRTQGLIDALRASGVVIVFCSPARDGAGRERLERSGISTRHFKPNDPSFNEFVKEWRPEVTIFDRFSTEEQFGWRVRENAPECARILDTIDLHSLRRSREAVARTEKLIDTTGVSIAAGEDQWRELASILRSDLSWVVSPVEALMLTRDFGIAAELIEFHPVPGMGPPLGVTPNYIDRQGFAFIGNFRHAPNLDAVQWLRAEIWPLIRARLPKAEVRVYGSYPVREATELHSPQEGFLVEGWVADAAQALARVRVNLAPLRYGAGVKGKVIEGWRAGTPTVGTPIAAEGLTEFKPKSVFNSFSSGDEDDLDPAEWGGEIAMTAQALANRAVALHEDAHLWQNRAKRGTELYLQNHWGPELGAAIVRSVRSVHQDLSARRGRNWIGQMLWHHQFKSTTYMSRWIELKTKLAAIKPS